MAGARQNLRRALFNLKAALGDAGALLQAQREEVVLEAGGCWVDVNAFRAPLPVGEAAALAAMEAQAALYHGPLLAGLEIPSPAFEAWLAKFGRRLGWHPDFRIERMMGRADLKLVERRTMPPGIYTLLVFERV